MDIDAGAAAVEAIKDMVSQTHGPEVLGGLGGFAGLFSVAALKEMQDPVLVSGADGVGTKLELAQRSQHLDSVGIDLVAMCVNDVVCCGARPLFFLDYIAVGKLDPPSVVTVVKGVAEGCRRAGCALIGGEMAEHPGVMAPQSLDLSGFCVGVVDKPRMIGPEQVQEGDIIIGLASTGLHSNGFSLVRRVVTDRLSDDNLLSEQMANGQLLIDALLEPTAIYAQPLVTALADGLPIHAAAHITGGGLTHNLNRALPIGLNARLQLGSWVIPPVIQHLAYASGLEMDALLATFNMGIGMVLIVAPDAAGRIIKHFRLPGSQTRDRHGGIFTIGQVVKADNPQAAAQVTYLPRT
ncbi:MAG: phosphoribosylformylglycinamidine cyclo-ligase [Coriobacteriales bacterium]|nr:phosphoribosylformylglycinamidine cyclo-ligase [Coriobacteriales bacterium]